jgi:hypothetical protein
MALTETTHAGGYILRELDANWSRENGTLNSGQNLAAGTVLGQLLTGAGAKVSGTGDGTVGAVTVGPDAQVGIYQLICIAETGNAGTFRVIAPNGTDMPNLTVAAAYSTSAISLTVADGANDWDIGDVIHVTVTGGDYEALDLAATDGTQVARAILYASTNATDADTRCAVTARGTSVNGNELTWPDSITAAQQAIAMQQLARAGIIIR